MRNIRIVLEDEEATLVDEVRKENNITYRQMLMLCVKSKKNEVK